MRWKMRKHRFKYAGVKSPRRGSCLSRVVVPVLIFFVLLCVIVLYVQLGTSMIKSNALKSEEEHKDMIISIEELVQKQHSHNFASSNIQDTDRMEQTETQNDFSNRHNPQNLQEQHASQRTISTRKKTVPLDDSTLGSKSIVNERQEGEQEEQEEQEHDTELGNGLTNRTSESDFLNIDIQDRIEDNMIQQVDGNLSADQSRLSADRLPGLVLTEDSNQQETQQNQEQSQLPKSSWKLALIGHQTHVGKISSHRSALQIARAKSKAHTSKQAQDIAEAKIQSGFDMQHCKEKGWCKFNLKIQADGSPHDNCASWLTDCPCTCAPGQVAPPKRVVEFFHDHVAVKFEEMHGTSNHIYMKSVSGNFSKHETLVKVATVNFSEQLPWQEIISDTSLLSHDTVLDPRHSILKYNVVSENGFAYFMPKSTAPGTFVHSGALPEFLDYVAESAHWNSDLLDFYIVHVVNKNEDIPFTIPHDNTSTRLEANAKLRSNFFVNRVSWDELSARFMKALEEGSHFNSKDVHPPCWDVHADRSKVQQHLIDILKAQSASVYGSKINDLKVLFGGMFRDWLQEYSHWGWFDTDIIFGDLSSALRPYLDSADVVTFPDGVLNALYLSGQLTIFRNNDFFRTCFVAGTSLPRQHICQKGNRLSDEKYSLYHVLRSKRTRVIFDMTRQFSATKRAHHAKYSSYQWILGHIFRAGTRSTGMAQNQAGIPKTMNAMQKGATLRNEHSCVVFWDDWTFKCLDAPSPMSVYNFSWPLLTGAYYASLPITKLVSVSAAKDPVDYTVEGTSFEEAAFLHLFDWKREMTYLIGHSGARNSRAFEIKKEANDLVIHASDYHVFGMVNRSLVDGNILPKSREPTQISKGELLGEVLQVRQKVNVNTITIHQEDEKLQQLKVVAKEQEIHITSDKEENKKGVIDADQVTDLRKDSVTNDLWQYIAPNVESKYFPSAPRNKAEFKDKKYEYKRKIFSLENGENWAWNQSDGSVSGLRSVPRAPSQLELIPRIVHFIITDSSSRYFDWTCYVAVMSAKRHVKPTKILMHVLEGAKPKGPWYAALSKMEEFAVVPFSHDDIPRSLNGKPVTHPAHMSDFRRMQMLLKYGGLYFDTDHILIRPIDELLHFSEVFGRQGKNEHGYQVCVGFIMARQNSKVIAEMLDKMKEKFNGGWVSHSVNMVDNYFDRSKYSADASPPCMNCLVLPYGALFPFSWNRKDLCCDYYYHEGKPETSLFGGTGFRWNNQYSVHLFHSQSERMTRYYVSHLQKALAQKKSLADEARDDYEALLLANTLQDEDEVFYYVKNFAVAVYKALGHDGLDQLIEKMHGSKKIKKWENYDDAVKKGWVVDAQTNHR